MKNVLDKSWRENENTLVVFNNIFSEHRTIYEIMSKNIMKSESNNWRHNMVHTRCMLDKQGYMHVPTSTRPRAHAHTDRYVYYLLFFHGKND
jgi:hypothetical protein